MSGRAHIPMGLRGKWPLSVLAMVVLCLHVEGCLRCDIQTDLSHFDQIQYRSISPSSVLHVHLSNQSEMDRLVDVAITINDTVVITGVLDRGNYHVLKSYDVALDPGEYIVRAKFNHKGGHIKEMHITMTPGDEIHMDITYYFHLPNDGASRIEPPDIKMRLLDGPPMIF